mmetsp:Transcript_49054/g.59384  ORF Transcript_49054/g.59384 Transcript_49054/m.59384 type:complete len:208 (+) Transcript_49054:480-1103(+)
MSLDGSQKVTRDHFGTLMNELIKGVLPVGSRFTPDDRSRLASNFGAVLGNIFSIRLHISLLEVSRETVHVLIIRKYRNCLGIVKVVVPSANKSESHWQVFLRRSIKEMLIHGVRASVHLHPIFKADGKRNRSSDGGPKRVPPTYPIPESKHVVRVDTKLAHALGIGTEGRKVLCNGRFILVKTVQNPLFGTPGVSHSFLRGERFTRN